MAIIKNTYICPRCEEGITGAVKPEFCPNCNFRLALPGDGGFSIPVTITEQQERINNKKDHIDFVLKLPVDVANNILNDALNIIETVPGKKVRASDIRTMMGMAIKIGEIAKKYEEFLQAGGTHTPELFLSGDTNELQTTRNGEKPTRAVPTPLFTPMGKDD